MQKQPFTNFYNISAIKYLVKFTGKQFYQNLFWNKVAGLQPTILLKKNTPEKL